VKTMTNLSPIKLKVFNLSLVLASLALALVAVSAPAHAAPVKAVRALTSGKPVNLIRQAPVADAAAGRDYSARLWNRILNQWNYPNGNNHVTIVATVSGDGNVENVQVTSSPKSTEAEAAAQAAFEKAKPLDALPKGMTAAKVTMLFNSKADPHGDSSSGGSVRVDPIHSVRNLSNESESAPASASKSETESESEPEPKKNKIESKSKDKPPLKKETSVETKSENKSETRVENKADVHIETAKTEIKTEAKSEAKPDSKPDSSSKDEFGGH